MQSSRNLYLYDRVLTVKPRFFARHRVLTRCEESIFYLAGVPVIGEVRSSLIMIVSSCLLNGRMSYLQKDIQMLECNIWNWSLEMTAFALESIEDT